MQGKAVCRLVEVTDDFQSELVFLVRPNSDCPVGTACGKKLLLYANVQPVHLLGVERSHQVLVLLLRVRTLKVDVHFYYLMRVRREYYLVFLWREGHVDGLVVHDVLVKHFVVLFVLS